MLTNCEHALTFLVSKAHAHQACLCDLASLQLIISAYGYFYCRGMLVPLIGVYIRQRFDSYMPLFVQAVGIQLIGGMLFFTFAAVESPLAAKSESKSMNRSD